MGLLHPDEAWRRIAERVSPLPEESGWNGGRRPGGCWPRDLAATVDVPAADVSAMDGYAVGRRGPARGTPCRSPAPSPPATRPASRSRPGRRPAS